MEAIKVFADGTQAPASDPRTDHVAALFPATGLMFHTVSLGKGRETTDSAKKLCDDLRVLGHDDWRLAVPKEWLAHVIDHDHYHPAVDPNLFPGIKPDWHQTGVDCAWSKDAAGVASAAWVVGAYYGLVGYYVRDNGLGFALAVRSAGQP